MHEQDIRERLEAKAATYGVGPAPFQEVESAARRRRRMRVATTVGATAVAVILLGTGGAILLGNDDKSPGPQPATAAGPQCLSQTRQGLAAEDGGRFSARVTAPDCSVKTISGTMNGESSVEVWPSKNGKSVVLVEGTDEASTLKIRDLESGDTKTVFEGEAKIREARLSPDGTMIAIEMSGAPKGGYGHVQLVDVRSGAVTRLPETVHSARPHWSPDGFQLLYLTAVSQDEPAVSVPMIYDLANMRSSPVEDLPDGLIENSAWSPDGSQIAVVRTVIPEDGSKPQVSIATLDLATGQTETSRANLSRALEESTLDLGWDRDSLTLVSLDPSGDGTTTTEISDDLQRVATSRTDPGTRVLIW